MSMSVPELEKKITLLVATARRRRAHVHASVMASLTALQYERALPFLASMGFAVNDPARHHSCTPLGMSIVRGNYPAFKALLRFGADPHDVADDEGHLPIDLVRLRLQALRHQPRECIPFRAMLRHLDEIGAVLSDPSKSP